jgi:two-component system cell cycle sensor histidine kinase/response regulator CckA
MSTFPPGLPAAPEAERRWRRFSFATGLVCLLFGGMSLVASHLGWLHRPAGTDWTWLVPATALSLMLGAGVVMLAPYRAKAARRLAAVTLYWSGVVLAQRMLVTPGPWLWRLSPAMVLAIGFAAGAQLPERRRPAAIALLLLTGFTGLVTVIEKLLAAAPWAPLGPDTRIMNPSVGLVLLALSAGWLAAEPRQRPASFFREPGSAGWLMRRLVPAVLVFPFLLSWIRSEQHNPFASWAGSLVFVVASFMVFLTLVWKAATALDRLDVSRADLQAYAHEISDLYHHAPCGYHSLDADGRFVKINDTELSWLGYRREEIERMAFTELLTPASRKLFDQHFAALKESGAVQDLELELRRKDGSLLPVVVNSTAIRDFQGRFLRTRSTLFDATQRKQAEAALRMSEARNRAILASAPDAIVTLEEGGAIADFNPAAEVMFGMERSVAVTRAGAALIAEGSPLRRRPLAALAGASENAPTGQIEFLARRADGSVFPAELTMTRVAGQSPGLFTAFVRDLTQRKQAEAELRASEERLRLVLDSTGEGIYALDLNGVCTLCNPAAVRLLGFAGAEELLGRPLHELIHHAHADGAPYPAEACRSMLAARQGIGIEVDDEVFWRKDGTSMPVEYRSYPVMHNDQPVGLVVSFSDVTQRRSLEQQIRQAQKMEAVGRLAAGIAHDFNNLLTVINGYSEMLLEAELDADTQDKLRSVRAAGDRAATLTHQLLAFSRQQVLQPRVLDLNAVVRALEPLLRRSIGEDIELTFRLAADLQPVQADPSQIDQVLMNLVVNARDAMPEGGRLEVETGNAELDEAFVRPHAGLAPGRYARLRVRDSGTGMRPETQSHIFEPFFTTKPQGKGTGLGLPTVFGIARQSGGTVLVESEWGRGTTMEVYLPVFQGAAKPAPVTPAATIGRAAGGGETVLVVEDEDDLRRLLLEVLRGRGYTVLEASRPEQALEVSEQYAGHIDLLVTDVVMPNMNGPALAAKLRQQRPELPVLFISGYSEPAQAPRPFLKKPFPPEALAQAVRALLDQESSREAGRAGGRGPGKEVRHAATARAAADR